MNILSVCSDLIWPRHCRICGGAVDRPARHVCSACLMRVPFVKLTGCCRVCGRAVEGLDDEFLCADCAGEGRPCFDRAASALRFEGIGRDMVNAFKFRREFSLRNDFVDWLEAAARARLDVSAVDVVLPMPLTRFRRWDRGYNQSAILARVLAARLDRRYDDRVLRRTGSPKRQSTLNEIDRRENVKGTIAVRRPAWVRGRTVLVVDDIMTTGSTLSECARVLKLAGASRVWCATLARSIRV